MKVTIRDESATGNVLNELTLEILTEQITVRELLRSRVYQEVNDYNLRLRQGLAEFRGLVNPKDAPPAYAGIQVHKPREIDWKDQFEKACEGFDRNSILVLVNDRQAETLEEPLTLRHDTRVSFIKLTPLVGG